MIEALEVGAQTADGKFVAVICLFTDSSGEAIVTRWLFPEARRLVGALAQFNAYLHAADATIEAKADDLHRTMLRKRPSMTVDQIENAGRGQDARITSCVASINSIRMETVVSGRPLTLELGAALSVVCLGYVLNVFEQFDLQGAVTGAAGAQLQ